MDTNITSQIPQIASQLQVTVNSIVIAVGSILGLIAMVGRVYHAWSTGNSATSALVKGTNSPVTPAAAPAPVAAPATPPPGSLAGTITPPTPKL